MSIDLNDIQGNIVKAYGHFQLPKARYVFFQVQQPTTAQRLLRSLIPLITRAGSWDNDNPDRVTSNIAFTYSGLKALGLPRESLVSFPAEFTNGMRARKSILCDEGVSDPSHWDPIWNNERDNIHVWLSINGRTQEDVELRYQEILDLNHSIIDADGNHGFRQLIGHLSETNEQLPYQDAAALTVNGMPTRKEHFGYDDGISDPYFKGCGLNPSFIIGGGKPSRAGKRCNLDPSSPLAWEALETGEFILGYRDEAQELPPAPIPLDLSKNGSFMVYRKLHENVHSFNQYIQKVGKVFPGGEEMLSAKLVGRWKNGAPLATFPDQNSADTFGQKHQSAMLKLNSGKTRQENAAYQEAFDKLDQKLRSFNFNQDLHGSRCPMGAHIRRTNPRGCLEHGNAEAFETPGALVDRRRILRRGLPYGRYDPNKKTDQGNHGIIFMAINASIKRQFEFVQQQWVNYGNDFKLANDRDPIIGNQPVNNKNHQADGRMVIEGEKNKKPPFFCGKIPSFVETRGGDYFFIPSITALGLIAHALVDPT